MLDEYYSSLYRGDAFEVLKQQLTTKVRQGRIKAIGAVLGM
jgi:hypothetical protein